MDSYEYLLAGAVEAAYQSGKVIRKYYRGKFDVREKGKLGLVTTADIEAEAVAMKVLRKCEPGFGFLTEEAHSKAVQTKTETGMWIIDPLDGTTNFVHRFPMFCVTIAAEIKGKVVAAVTYHPVLDEMYTAIRGQGAFMNGERISVSKTAKMKSALLSTGFTQHQAKGFSTEMSSFEKISGACRAVRRSGSAALDMAYTARGVFDGFWERHLYPWDVAAGSLLVEEAGGKVSDFKGKKFSTRGVEVLATNGKVHRQILSKI